MNHPDLFHPFPSRYSVRLLTEVRLSFSASSSQSWWQGWGSCLRVGDITSGAEYIITLRLCPPLRPLKPCLLQNTHNTGFYSLAESTSFRADIKNENMSHTSFVCNILLGTGPFTKSPQVDLKVNVGVRSHSPWYNFSIDRSEEDPIALPLAMASVFDHIPKFKCPQGQVKIRGKCFKLTSS